VSNIPNNDTICALATPAGVSAIGVIRLSGVKAIIICEKVFSAPSSSAKGKKKLSAQKTHTIHYGTIKDGKKIIDEVLVSIFKNPHSYTGEDLVEVSCHGSAFVQQELIQLFIKKGARIAKPGEFTLRAFLNGKLDLSQAEAVADLIASNSEASHKIAMQQMRGGFSQEIKQLRQQLVNFASLIELELDFSEEDVEFANRKDLKKLLEKMQNVLDGLIKSFAVGNVIKNGIPVAIIGEPNVGKSTLLNVLLNEERAIVSEIPGTTRDAIEDTIVLNGIAFRFIDTAGIRATTDTIETIGIAKTYEKIGQAAMVLYLFDSVKASVDKINTAISKLHHSNGQVTIIINKTDKGDFKKIQQKFRSFKNIVFISAKNKQNIHLLTDKLSDFVNIKNLSNNEVIITNSRHYEALTKSLEAIDSVYSGLTKSITGDLLAIDIRTALHHLGEITGEITTDEILGNIFSKFCIGK